MYAGCVTSHASFCSSWSEQDCAQAWYRLRSCNGRLGGALRILTSNPRRLYRLHRVSRYPARCLEPPTGRGREKGTRGEWRYTIFDFGSLRWCYVLLLSFRNVSVASWTTGLASLEVFSFVSDFKISTTSQTPTKPNNLPQARSANTHLLPPRVRVTSALRGQSTGRVSVARQWRRNARRHFRFRSRWRPCKPVLLHCYVACVINVQGLFSCFCRIWFRYM